MLASSSCLTVVQSHEVVIVSTMVVFIAEVCFPCSIWHCRNLMPYNSLQWILFLYLMYHKLTILGNCIKCSRECFDMTSQPPLSVMSKLFSDGFAPCKLCLYFWNTSLYFFEVILNNKVNLLVFLSVWYFLYFSSLEWFSSPPGT